MMSRNQPYVAVVAVTVLFGVSGLIMSSANPFAFATTNQAVQKEAICRITKWIITYANRICELSV